MFTFECVIVVSFINLVAVWLLKSEQPLVDTEPVEFNVYAVFKDRLLYSNIVLNGMTKDEFYNNNTFCEFYFKRENKFCIMAEVRSNKIKLIEEKTAKRLYSGDFDE